ncbi:unnamed protein product [Tetraodon nigroviridis]|uniref:(spotted green pufferfish) hypothetical protein n=1 Tax=Tetraodon nigroviridis TaxID=99883 RepID=Q4SWF8_TETNG|nr:unnamed protein product [Tetraodon nigroviridis]
MEIHSTLSQAAMKECLQRYCCTEGTTPLLLFPEEGTTNGRVGLLKFSSWPVSLTDSIQHVALRVTRPLISLNAPESSWLVELFWTFFAPCTVYHVSWLPPVSRQDGESLQEFANKVQELLAVELGLVSTKMTKADKAEHIKRQRRSVPQTAASVNAMGFGFKVQGLTTDDNRLAKMAKRVKDVLPHVPLNIITTDLGSLQPNHLGKLLLIDICPSKKEKRRCIILQEDAILRNMDWIKKTNTSGQATIEHLSETGIFNLQSCIL